MRRTIAWGTIPPGMFDVVIELEQGGRYAGQIHEGLHAGYPDTFIQFIPGPKVAGTAVAYGFDEPIWAYSFETDRHTTRIGTLDAESLVPALGPGHVTAVGGGEFEGWPYELWLRTTARRLCLAADARDGLKEVWCAARSSTAVWRTSDGSQGNVEFSWWGSRVRT